ncbi:PREDICTED: centromere/kinetochore protein zw10 homolog [Ceratosolen solmsi marchali]|uniref:Centromere/kinetochore protein zw10 homolog n=1 Tax=Ceratosolen solmsi marchali TaxID=326594 RepID=A0AAJ7DXM4_9HYME|nr:PREDICTED: centromere/kinetochore protein zw10 homolog [Ceratosolen solmsi marchali]
MSSSWSDISIVTDEKGKPDFNKTIEFIKKEILKQKSVVNESMKDKVIELEQNIKPDEILIKESEQIIEEIKTLQNRINDQVKVKLSASSKDLQKLSLDLKEYNYSLNLSNQLLQIFNAFEYIENYKTSTEKQQTAVAITLLKLYTLVIDKSVDIQELNIYEALKEEYYKIYDNFIEEIDRLWQEKICWNETNLTSELKSVTLCIQCDSDELTDIVQALHYHKKLSKCIQSFSTKLLQYFIKPIICSNCVIKSSDKTFYIEILDNKELPCDRTVLNDLVIFFKFLYNHFNFIILNEEYFLSRLSIPLLQEFSHLLTEEYISKIIPTSKSELQKFKFIISKIEEFQNYLIEIKFLLQDQKFLSKYTDNLDKLYIDNKCGKLLEVARNIMKKDLHDSFQYEPENLEDFSNNDHIKDIVINRQLSKFTFYLPACQISKSAQEILYLVEEILEEACNNSGEFVLRLFYTSRNIFEMYAALMPEIHKSFIKTIPQQAALFHNNCFYLAHQLLTLPFKYNKKLQVHLHNFSMTYIDQVLLLREVGSKYFLNHMKYQRDIIFDILHESGLSLIGQISELSATTERAFRQCIRQLELLKTVWIEILPMKVYCRVLGCIINDMIDDLSTNIVNVEDIPAKIASDLVTLLNMVVERIPQIFPNSVLIEQYIKKWRQLNELIIILGASLQEIEDRWADGKGPLANEFSSQHVRRLIRALFQNTDRRSKLLHKIKDKSYYSR